MAAAAGPPKRPVPKSSNSEAGRLKERYEGRVCYRWAGLPVELTSTVWAPGPYATAVPVYY